MYFNQEVDVMIYFWKFLLEYIFQFYIILLP